MVGDWEAELVILSGPRAGASYALGAEEVVVGESVTIRLERGRHVVAACDGKGLVVNGEPMDRRRLAEHDQLLIGETHFAYCRKRPLVAGRGEKATLLRSTTLLYLFRAWEKSGGQSSRALVEKQILSVVGNLLGYQEDLQGEIVDSAETRADDVEKGRVVLPMYVDGRRAASLVLQIPKDRLLTTDDMFDVLAAIANLASVALESARESVTLRAEVAWLEERIFAGGIVGDSQPIRRLRQMIERVAASEATILILGESGTGKELVARAVHEASGRKAGPFVPINCAAITDTLLESELFGHEKGSFTGAEALKKGRLEMAQGGTVFLDEVGELAPGLQAKLLRVLQEREMFRVGGMHPVKLDVRILAATNRDLAAEVRTGKFREDLFHRLNVIALRTPPLRERKDDIPALAHHFLVRACRQCQRRIVGFSPEAERAMQSYDWPGNIRELENAIERAVVLAESESILPEDLPETIAEASAGLGGGVYQQSVGDAKRISILRAYESSGGDYKAAARLLGIHPNYLLRLVRNLGLKDEVSRKAGH